MSCVSPPLDTPLEFRAIRRFAATMVGHGISRLEKLKWRLEESPSREQVVAWQRPVFEPIRWWFDEDVEPPIDREAQANVSQVCRYLPEFAEVWSEFRRHPGKDERTKLKHVARQLNMELAEAYGLPAVHPD